MILSDEEIKRLIEEKDLIKNFIDLDIQLQPASFDLTLAKVFEFESNGSLDFDNSERKIAERKEIEFKNDWVFLKEGSYLIMFNEIVKIPKDLIALVRPRSSLLRNGASIFSSLWDPGYEGRSLVLLVVFNENGIKLKKNARIAQMIFLKLEEESRKEYRGIYQKENV
ncbi:MAG: dCTP deaminase [Candidatus Aenigmarchaeota archaeon ex4484_224]|nr:MAG: dCTP deaminase [Candidatus Aenigmarchaeota archaeon ex4484_224]